MEALSRHSTNFASSSSFPAKPSMSSAKPRLMIVLPPMLAVPSSKTRVIVAGIVRETTHDGYEGKEGRKHGFFTSNH